MAKFKIGDRVKMHAHFGDSKPIEIGWLGTVIALDGGEFIGVCWDEFMGGHNCSAFEELEKRGLPKNRSRWMDFKCLRHVIEEAKPEPEKPSIKPAKPKPWFAPIESDIDELLEMSFEFKPASELFNVAVSGNWTAPKPQATDSKPKQQPKKEEKTVKGKCCKCAAYQQIADCEYGFCSSWHNFAGKEELCSRFKAVETVDK